MTGISHFKSGQACTDHSLLCSPIRAEAPAASGMLILRPPSPLGKNGLRRKEGVGRKRPDRDFFLDVVDLESEIPGDRNFFEVLMPQPIFQDPRRQDPPDGDPPLMYLDVVAPFYLSLFLFLFKAQLIVSNQIWQIQSLKS